MNSYNSFEQSMPLLEEIRLSPNCSPANLAEFAGLVADLYLVLQNQEDPSADLEKFTIEGSTMVEKAVRGECADDITEDSLERLTDQAIDCWGEELLAMREARDAWPAETSSAVQDQEPEEGDSYQTPGTQESPSSAQVEDILRMVGLGAESPSATESDLPTPPASGLQDSGNANSNSPSPESLGGEVARPTESTQPAPSPTSIASILGSLRPELREAYIYDAVNCLGVIESSVLQLDSDPTAKDPIVQIQRELHTLKGASASVGLMELADQLHEVEEVLRQDEEAGRAPCVDDLLDLVDQLRAAMSQLDAETPSSETSAPPATAQPTNSDSTKISTPDLSDDGSDDDLVRVKSSQLNRLMDMLAELVMLRNQKETELGQLKDVYHELITSVSKMRLLSNDSELRADEIGSLQLSEIANDVLETAQHLRDCTQPFVEGNAAVSRFIRQFRQELVELRRTPISGLFRRLQRVVRDAARAESKQVRLSLVGEDAGIERALQQRLYEPLLHIVRNSVCHGIEESEKRTQLGKSAEGQISIEARSGPDLFVIEIRDDGAGLNYEAIRRRGIERGLLTAEQAVTDQELSQLIFHPGFSTRDSANQVGGRGVGMDVVAATLQRMRGWLEIDSEQGVGTRIRLSLPLPSVVQHAMVFRCANQLFALPMESVQGAGQPIAGVPQYEFARVLGFDSSPSQFKQALLVASPTDHGIGSPNSVALLVDEILGPEEVVVRPLPNLLRNHPFCVGASLSGMGKAVILLDARRVLQARQISGLQPQHQIQDSTQARPRILVVDDSLSARKRAVSSLQRYPVQIVEAKHGKEALELLKQSSFTAIFSDMEMPHVDGMQLLTEVKSSLGEAAPPMVIISSRFEDEFVTRAKQLGAADYLIKPLADESLDKTIANIEAIAHLVNHQSDNLEALA